ncbi:MAG: UDP-N-acetylmuramoyl-L-alanine--D-glutamate ligase [Candidatus Uhrbacteria bacterium]
MPRPIPTDFRDHRITVMGLGLHGGGLATASWFLRHGADVTVTDLKTRAELRPSAIALEAVARRKGSGELTLVLGKHRAADFRDADLIVQNPGVPRESPYLRIARLAGVPIANDASIAFALLRALASPPRIVAVTGTRGKSTTAALIYAMCVAAGRTAFLGGNIRIPIFSILDRLCAAARRGSVDVILELSSWQCERLDRVSGGPDVAVLTNLLTDHLNRYRGMRDYANAKERILFPPVGHSAMRAPIVVANLANQWTRTMARQSSRDISWFTPSATASVRVPVFTADDRWFFRRVGRRVDRIAPRRALAIPGSHNVANALAAIAAARALDLSDVAIRRALRTFSGLSGRFEVVSRRDGITFINDTCATTPDATIAALRTAMEWRGDDEKLPMSPAPLRPMSGSSKSKTPSRAFGLSVYDNRPKWCGMSRRQIILIAGGTDKELNYCDWAKEIIQSVKSVVFLPGSATEKMEHELQKVSGSSAKGAGASSENSKCSICHVASMRAAVSTARRLAERGNIILLSPGAASFGLFLHEFDRGEQFIRAVRGD